MAEILLYVAEDIIGKLISFAIKILGPCFCVGDQVKKLKDTVSNKRAVLIDVEPEEEEMNDEGKVLVKKLKDAVYEAHHLLEDYEDEVSLWQEDKLLVFFSCCNQIAYVISMGPKMKEVRERLDTLEFDRVKFGLPVSQEGRRVANKGRRGTESSVPEIVVGRDGDKDKVMKLLLTSDGEKVSVVSIVGLGELGKTTLAQLVSNEDEVKMQFSLRLWVCVSDSFDVKLVVQKILESATEQKTEDLELSSLKTKLEKVMKEKIGERKCLLVLDDVWNENEEEWQRLKNLVRGAVGEGSCKIIVTTRLQRVAEITCTLRPYVLKGLTMEESWSLLVQLVFRGQQPENSGVIEIGKQIVEKCLGVPLVIKTIGSVLREKNSETKWLSFLQKELSGVVENDVVMSRLKLSYDHLPLHLKQCFAYCGLFPKDHEISVETLIHLWISQGFIPSSNRSPSLEDIGYECFMDLWWKSFFQDVKKDLFGNVTSCKMHDLMHDLATSMAKPESTILLKSSGDFDGKTRHVSLGYDLESPVQIPSYLLGVRSLRSLLLPSQANTHHVRGSEEESPKDIFSSFKHLRAVDLHNLGLKEVSSSIGNQKHLRYLDVSKNEDITVLSSSITKLQKLLVLKVVDCKRLKELPEDIGKLPSLRHLLCEGCDSLTYMPRGIGQLTSLQTLSWFILAKDQSVSEKAGGLNELNKLNKLRKLAIKNLGYKGCTTISEFKAANLKEKEHLESLVLRWSRDYFDESSLEILEPHSNLKQIKVHEYGGLRFPSWLSRLTSLVEIRIVDCHQCQHLPPMDQLPFLKELRIKRLYDLEFVDSGGNWYLSRRKTLFPSLEKLLIWNCPSLKGWWKEIYGDDRDNDPITASAELPKIAVLSLLDIRYCPQLTRLPLFKCLSQTLNFVNANLEPLQQNLMIPLSPSVCISSLTNVVEIWIESIGGYKHLPSFDQIPSLRDLRFDNLYDLEYVSCMEDFYLSRRSGDSMFFRSLKKIRIRECPSLKGWWKNDYNNDDATVATDMELPQFPCLSLFEVELCPLFTSVPGLSYLDQNLSLKRASMVPVKQLQVQCPKVVYSNVVQIVIEFCSGCRSIPPLDQLPSLEDLHFRCLDDLEYIDFDPRGAAFFPSLEKLFIGGCSSLIGWRSGENDDSNCATTSISGVSLPQFPCLLSLEIIGCPKLISLPPSQTLAEKLFFINSNIKSFPSNVSSLTDLREIWLCGLPNLEYVDQGEAGLTIDRRAFFPFLKTLRISGCPDLKGWWKNSNNVKNLPQFPNIDELCFDYCSARLLPSRLSSFTYLKELRFSDMNDLEYIDTEGNFWLSRQATGSSTVLPCLKKLYIENCPKLKGWWRISEHDSSTNGNPPDLPHFPKLSILRVEHCPMFTMMPLFPTLDDNLCLEDVSLEIFQQTVKMKPTSVQPPLSNLKALYICNVPNLEYMNCTVFPFLRKLWIYDCAILKGWWANQDEDAYDIAAVTETSKFPQLSLLKIKNCPMLTSMLLFPSLDDELILKNASIEPLLQTMEMKIKMKGKLKMMMKLKALVPTKSFCCSSTYAPNSQSSIINPLCKLKRLSIEKVEDFRSLPENWLQKLTSLEELTIKDCPRLVSVPQRLKSLASIKVEISGCPQLKET